MSFLFRHFFDPEFHDAGDEVQRHWLADGELHGAFAGFVGGEFLFECFAPGGRRVEADVVFICGEVDEVAVQFERGDGVADGLGGGWCGFVNGGADLLEDGLCFLREAGDVFIDVGGVFHVVWVLV